jgi:hypothetical protein
VKLFRFVILVAAVAIVVFPAGIALGQPPADAFRALPDTVERGETFNVTVNFTAPADNFSAPALTDFCPAGWNVTVSGSWTQPPATVLATGNKADFIWWQSKFSNGTNFTVLYKVTVPCDANLTNYTFDGDNWAYLSYFIGNSSQIWGDITGDANVTVVPPAICSAPSIDFYAAYNGTNPGNKTLELWSSTPCILNWSLSDDADWLEAYPTNGTCTDVHSPVNLSMNISGMPLGNYTANITIESPDANNSPRIVPVTLHITEFGVLKGQVSFMGRGDAPNARWIESFEVKLFAHGNLSNVLWTGNATTNENGLFTIPDVVVGVYDVGIKNATCLSELVTNVTIDVGPPTEVDFGEIREGDASNDDYIDGSDLSLLSTAWYSYPGCPGGNWDARVDFNHDNIIIDGSDLSLLNSNWYQWGDLLGV